MLLVTTYLIFCTLLYVYFLFDVKKVFGCVTGEYLVMGFLCCFAPIVNLIVVGKLLDLGKHFWNKELF